MKGRNIKQRNTVCYFMMGTYFLYKYERGIMWLWSKKRKVWGHSTMTRFSLEIYAAPLENVKKFYSEEDFNLIIK